MLVISRRGFLGGLGALLASPAIVQFESIMPVKTLPDELLRPGVLPPGEIAAELADIVRRAFLPRIYVRLFQSAPLMERLAADARRRGDIQIGQIAALAAGRR